VDNDAQNGEAGNLVAEESVGSVTIRIYSSPTRVKIPHPEAKPGTPGEQLDFEYRTYDFAGRSGRLDQSLHRPGALVSVSLATHRNSNLAVAALVARFPAGWRSGAFIRWVT
jgi:hypothetical protein